MQNYKVFTRETASKIINEFKNKNGYIVKLLSSDKKSILGYIARCETPTEKNKKNITMYVQWNENNKNNIHDLKIIAMDRAMKVLNRHEKYLKTLDAINLNELEFTYSQFEDVFPEEKNLSYDAKCFLNTQYNELKKYAKNLENKVNLFYKENRTNDIVWGSSLNLKKSLLYIITE